MIPITKPVPPLEVKNQAKESQIPILFSCIQLTSAKILR